MATRKKPRTSGGESAPVRDLVRLLDDLNVAHTELLGAVREKLAAMRRADLHTMREMTIKEQTLARTIQEREGLRRQLTDIIGGKIGLAPGEARTLTVSQLATRLPVESGQALTHSVQKLRDTMHKVAQSNRVAGVACREVINHMKWVFASVRPKDDPPVAYAGNGTLVGSSATKLFEVVG